MRQGLRSPLPHQRSTRVSACNARCLHPRPSRILPMIAAPAPAGTSSAPTLAPPPAQYAGLRVSSFFVPSIVRHRASGTCATVDAVGLPPQQPAYAPPQAQGYAPQGYAPQGYAPQAYPPQAYAPQTNWCATFLACGLPLCLACASAIETAGPRSPCRRGHRRRSHSPKGIRRCLVRYASLHGLWGYCSGR